MATNRYLYDLLREPREQERHPGEDPRRDDNKSLFAELMREVARAVTAAERRAATLEQEMAERLRLEQARADAAEENARVADARADDIEQRAIAALRNLQKRAEVAEARVRAAETWIDRVRSAVSYGPDEIPSSREMDQVLDARAA